MGRKKSSIIKPLISLEEFLNKLLRIENYGYKPIYSDGYIGIKRKCWFVCPMCKNRFERLPETILRTQAVVCKPCACKIQGDKRKYGLAQARKMVEEKGFNPLFETYNKSSDKIRVQCKCGKIFVTKFNSIISENTKSCGHCDDPKIGDIINDLTIIKIKYSRSCGCSVKAMCKCGQETKWYNWCFLKRGSVKTCGNCNNKVNGLYTSHVALKLQQLTDTILNQKGEHNFNIPYVGNVDIYYPNENIIIEYCGYYTHRIQKDKTKIDQSKYKRIIKEGYKLLIVNAAGNIEDLPSEKQLKKILLNDFQHGCKKKTIRHRSWYQAINKYKQREIKKQNNGGKDLINYYSREEEEFICNNADKLTNLQIAQILKRTTGSIATRKSILRRRGYKVKHNFVSDAILQTDIDFIITNWDMPVKQIAQHLNRSILSIYTIRYELRKSGNVNKKEYK